MPDDSPLSAGILDHRSGYLAGEWPGARLGCDILSGNADVRSFKPIRHRLESSKHRGDYYLTVSRSHNERLESPDEFQRFRNRLIHLPVSSYDWSSHLS